MRRIAHIIHRWVGLGAFLWLAVLGFTGIVLDHHEWSWFRQYPVTDAFASEQMMREQVKGTLLRQFALNPDDASQMIAGGERGLWRTSDGGQSWTGVAYQGAEGTPRLLAMFGDLASPWDRVWIATNQGLWMADGGQGPARAAALPGKSINFLGQDEQSGALLGVADHSQAFIYDPIHAALTWVPLPDNVENLPDISLVRLLQDWHVGQGLFDGTLTLLWNDIAGVALVVLGITGFLFWFLPRRWKSNKGPQLKTKRATLRWLFRFHGPVLGLIVFVPIITLSLSGVFLDHARPLIPSLKEISLSQAILPGSYDLSSFDGEVHAIIPGTEKGTYWIATRLGLLKTSQDGKTWTYDPATPLPVQKLTGHPHVNYRDGVAFMGTHGGPNYVKLERDGAWAKVEGLGLRLMFQDAGRVGESWVYKSSGGFFTGDLFGDIRPLSFSQPQIAGMPIGLMLEDLHTGLMISTGFIWVNDLAAILAIILSVTGLINWWHRKWA